VKVVVGGGDCTGKEAPGRKKEKFLGILRKPQCRNLRGVKDVDGL